MKKCTELTLVFKMGRSKVYPVASSFHTTSPTADVNLQQKKLTYSQLPKLTLPPLQDTLAKFVAFAKPIQSSSQFDETCKAVDNFLRSGEAEKLNKILEGRAQKFTNWLTPWWLDIAYLEARTPLPVITSPGVAFGYLDFKGPQGQVECAARMIQAALNFHHKILSDELPEDKAGNIPFDMSQYKYLFGTTRIPKINKDEIRYGSAQPKWARHVIVTRNGHSFHVPVYGQNGELLGLDDLKTQIQAILPESESLNPHPINVVSSDGRNEWAAVYERLKKKSPKSIESYENALFIVCLDKDVPPRPNTTTQDEQMQQALTGGGTHQNTINRWFDKTIQLIVAQNGYNGLTYEHTPAEGPPIGLNYLKYCLFNIKKIYGKISHN
uniref:Choline/carnitine acyltransferase domain-containing protein n=1 Tax=Acrobeloides nanus TaxID=290746 RepID=A0A914CXX0_9BILA